MSFTIRLPVPPSSNALFANSGGRGRVKTLAYNKWIDQADRHFLTQKRGITAVSGRYRVDILLPANTRLDADNAIKATVDWLASRDLTADDRSLRRVTAEKADLPGDMMEVTVSGYA